MLAWLMKSYGYNPYPGKITILLASTERLGGAWRIKAREEQNIEVQVIPGTHVTCRTTHVQAFAEKLKSCLNRAQNN
jgi:hypothetical protein